MAVPSLYCHLAGSSRYGTIRYDTIRYNTIRHDVCFGGNHNKGSPTAQLSSTQLNSAQLSSSCHRNYKSGRSCACGSMFCVLCCVSLEGSMGQEGFTRRYRKRVKCTKHTEDPSQNLSTEDPSQNLSTKQRQSEPQTDKQTDTHSFIHSITPSHG